MLVAMETPRSARSSRVRCRFRAEPARPLGCSEPATERTGRPALDRRCPTHTHCSARVLPVNLAETVSEPCRRPRLSLLRLPPARLSRVPDLRHMLKRLPSSPAPAPPPAHFSRAQENLPCGRSCPDIGFSEDLNRHPTCRKHVPFCISPPPASLFALSRPRSKFVIALCLDFACPRSALPLDWGNSVQMGRSEGFL